MHESDRAYLLERKPDATTHEIEQFIERVAICIYDGRVSEGIARQIALQDILNA